MSALRKTNVRATLRPSVLIAMVRPPSTRAADNSLGYTMNYKALFTFVAASLAFSSATAEATKTKSPRFVAHLSGIEEVPALITEGEGNATFRVSAHTIRYRLKLNHLEGNVTFAHIHVGQKGANGGVAVFLCDNTGNPAAAGAPACPQSGVVSGTLTATDVLGPAAQGIDPQDFDGLLEALFEGVTYVNVHSSKFPAGELRGQIGRRGR